MSYNKNKQKAIDMLVINGKIEKAAILMLSEKSNEGDIPNLSDTLVKSESQQNQQSQQKSKGKMTDPATDKQLAYLKRLNVVIPNNCTKGQANELIEANKNKAQESTQTQTQPTISSNEQVKDNPNGPDTRLASPGQIQFISDLIEQKGHAKNVKELELDKMLMSDAKKLIDELKVKPRKTEIIDNTKEMAQLEKTLDEVVNDK